MNEQELCKKKLIDLSRQANRKGIVLFSDFLNLNELNIYHQNEKFFETKTEASGGVPFAERQIIAFIPDALYYEWQFPIAYLEIVPSYPKFAEKLGHRDILGHTVVKLSPVSADALEQQQKFEEKDGIITSNRLDSMIACVYKFSRSQALEFFKAEKVFVNGKCVQNPSYRCKEADIISVRGYGRFVFEREMGETNKGRMKVRYKLYG